MSGTQLSLAGYKLTFDDQFADDTNADIGLPGTPGIKWETTPFYGQNGTNGSNPAPPGTPGSLFSFSGGVLNENMDTSSSPYLDTNPNGVPGGFSQQYGYFEVRAKLVAGSGYNSDFWMMPNSGPWPPEIDVYEHNGYIPGDYEMTNHGGDSNTPPNNLDLYTVPNLTTQFNDFGVMVTPQTITWYINGIAQFSAPLASNENQPFNMILSGGPSNGIPWLPPPAAGSSDDYQIQWAHAYSNASTATAIAGMAGYQDHDGSTSLGAPSPPPPPPAPSPILITPGQGSFSDTAGNVYTLTAGDVATENGQPMNGGGGTGAMEYANSTVYGQDAGSGTWYTWDQSINDWHLAAAPPPAPGAPPPPPPPPPPPRPPAIQFIYPGSGTITDAAGDKFTLSRGDIAMENGAALNGGGGTSALEYANGNLYGEDALSGNWWQWVSSINDWQQSSPPDTTRVIVPTLGSVKDTAGNTYSINSRDNVVRNGSRITSDGDTSAVKLSGGNVFRLNDQTNVWSQWSNASHSWTPT